MAWSPRMRRRLWIGALLPLGLLASGCTADDLPRFGWPSGVTEQAKRMQHFWSWAFIAALAVGAVVWGLMFWVFIAYRKKKNSPLFPKQTKENLPLEFTYTAVPLLMVGVLFYFTVTTENFVTKTVADPAVTVHVTASKWLWDFGMENTKSPDPGAPGSDGFVHTVGTSDEVPILVLPVKQNIEYVLESKDVIHSFWVVPFLFKRDVFPHPEANNTANRIQNTIEQTGAFVGRCAEFCGTYHSAMNFEVRAVPQDVYTAYIDLRQQKDPATGAGYTAAAALSAVGKQFPSCGDLCSPRAITTYPIDPLRTLRAGSKPVPLAGGK